MNDAKNELVTETQNQTDPHLAKAEDFKVAGSGLGEYGYETPGKNQLTPSVECARYCEDDGPGMSGAGTPTPGDWGASRKNSSFKVETNKGEGNEMPSKMSIPFSVNLETGMVMPNVADIHNKEA